MRYVLSGLTSIEIDNQAFTLPAVVAAHGIDSFACPSCECIAEVISDGIYMPEGNYVLVGLHDPDAQQAVDAGYIEALPVNPTIPAYLAGDA